MIIKKTIKGFDCYILYQSQLNNYIYNYRYKHCSNKLLKRMAVQSYLWLIGKPNKLENIRRRY